MNLGYVCPDWARTKWNPMTATIVSSLGRTFTVVCATTRCEIFVSHYTDECVEFLRRARLDPDFAAGIDPEVEMIKSKIPSKPVTRPGAMSLGDLFGNALAGLEFTG